LISDEDFGSDAFRWFPNFIRDLGDAELQRMGQKFYSLRDEFLARRGGAFAASREDEANPPLTAIPTSIEQDSEFHNMERVIEELLRQRGFAAGVKTANCTCWSAESSFWKDTEKDTGKLWCLAALPHGVIRFGVAAGFLANALCESLDNNVSDISLAITMSLLNPGGEEPVNIRIASATSRLDLPPSIQQIQPMLKREGKLYWGIQLKSQCWIEEVRQLIADLVNAFVIYMTGGKPWLGPRDREGQGAEPGVMCVQTVPMPDPESSPFHSFTLLAKEISQLLYTHGYQRRNEKGSVSWDGSIGAAGTGVGWKLCYEGQSLWRFGVRRELLNLILCLQQQCYDCRFHVLPIQHSTRPVFHGFFVFDTEASYDRIRLVIKCLKSL
jgi:hypothetical protein